MSSKQWIDQIGKEVDDIISTDFIYVNTSNVPSDSDAALSYERAKDKKGKEITTCVLYVDIRNSVGLTIKHHSKTMGKVYTAFIKAIIKAGRLHGGHTRNIIGDRVMIVFPVKDCFTNAMACALTINHIAVHVINAKFTGVDFKCGIGIDYGKMKVIKVGVPRIGAEANANKGLVWAGKPANLASRLTDMANKTITETFYDVRRNPINPASMQRYTLNKHLEATGRPKQATIPLHLPSVETVRLTESEFANSFRMYNDRDDYFTIDGKMLSFIRTPVTTDFPSILFTEQVLKGLTAEALQPNLYSPISTWSEQTTKIRNVDVKVYGGSYTWAF